YGCRVDGIDLTPELVETGRVLTERCGLADRVVLQIGNALDLPYPDQTFDVVWCQNVSMNIANKGGLLAGVYRCLNPADCSHRRNIQSGRVATSFSRCPGPMTPRSIFSTLKT